ncbi:MAG TPA: NADPH-dependent 7-cyano-7-deazaguanine reductase QueF [Casimicrobiaceae bacterium]|nr:NADPH-dependent 7-cyano-7-deazaguanine reductase QueF [Casimicrobiaceae bacterium]
MSTERDSPPLGRPTTYPDRYDPSLLFSMDRAATREALGVARRLPFAGVDIWTAHEITWLDPRGKPQTAIGEFRVGADSPSLVESKSVKLYLGSFAQERVDTAAELARIIEGDLARACGAPVGVALVPPDEGARVAELPGESIDILDVAIEAYAPDAELLRRGTASVEEALRSALFRSTCPVTGQPDYADVLVRYRGPRIDRSALLKYLVSYRRHAGFHEACVERIFIDIAERCSPERLTVYARFLRRGGIDINPFRSNFEPAPELNERTPRQ